MRDRPPRLSAPPFRDVSRQREDPKAGEERKEEEPDWSGLSELEQALLGMFKTTLRDLRKDVAGLRGDVAQVGRTTPLGHVLMFVALWGTILFQIVLNGEARGLDTERAGRVTGGLIDRVMPGASPEPVSSLSAPAPPAAPHNPTRDAPEP